MNKILKWVLLTVGVVVVLVVIAAVLLPMLIDPNNYKDEISKTVYEETGRELTIGGEIKWTVFPSIGLGLSDVTLGNREGIADDPMFDIGEADISVKLVPLFSKRVEIGKVALSEVSIRMQSPGRGGTSTAPAAGAEKAAFSISGFEISHAHVTLENAEEPAEPSQSSNIELGQRFDLEGGFALGMPEQALQGDVKFAGLIQTAAKGKRFGIEGLDTTFKGTRGEGADRVSLDASVSADADIDLTRDTARLKNAVIALHDLLVKGDIDVTSVTGEPKFTGKINVAEFNPKSFMRAMGMDTPKTRKESALTRLQADMLFTGSANSVNMQDLSARFDDSNLTGNLKIDHFKKPRLAFNFQIDRLNLDDYEEMESTEPSGGQAAEADLSVDDFRGFTGGGEFRIGTLVLAGLTATDVSATMSATGSGVRFHPVVANFYGGKHEGDISIDATGPRPVLTATLGLSGVQAGGLVKDLTGTERLLGQAEFFLKARSDITNSASSMQTLSGDIAMSVLNGSIVGIDVTKTLSLVQSALGKQKDVSGESAANERTEFAELSMTGVIEKGVVTSKDLIMKSPLIRATGKGSFNLVDETVDYVLEPVLTGDAGVQGLDKLSGVAIPIRLSGNLYEPDYKVDVAAALLASQKDLIDQKKNELIGKLIGGQERSGEGADKDKNGDEAGDQGDPVSSMLGGLLGGKKKKDEKKDDGGAQNLP